jgi:hypothetical protein
MPRIDGLRPRPRASREQRRGAARVSPHLTEHGPGSRGRIRGSLRALHPSTFPLVDAIYEHNAAVIACGGRECRQIRR